jgi:hypothetical protein
VVKNGRLGDMTVSTEPTAAQQTSTQPSPQPAPSDIVATVADRLGRDQVFGPPVASGGTTLIPVARVRAGGGVRGMRPGATSTGAGVVARPLGAFAVGPDGKVAWHPAVDVNRIVLGGQLALAAVLVAASRRLRRRRR